MIIGKPITALMQGGGLVPTVVVTAPTGSTVQLDGVTVTEISGTWTFTTTLGTHTISATLGAQSKTVSVVVSSVAVYAITIAYQLYLYNEGDECTSVTGGWQDFLYTPSCTKSGTATKRSGSLYLYQRANGDYSIGFRTANKIDVTNYSTIYVAITIAKRINGYAALACGAYGNQTEGVLEITWGGTGVKNANISNKTGDNYIGFGVWWPYELEITKIWLE